MDLPQKRGSFPVYFALLIVWIAMLVLWVIRCFTSNKVGWDRGDWIVFVAEGVLLCALVVLYTLRVVRLRRQRSRAE